MSDDTLPNATSENTLASEQVDALWSRLELNPQDREASESLVRQFNPLVRSELYRARAHFPSHVDSDELETAGLEGLFLSVLAFRRKFGVSFENYARRRIRGAMLDRVRMLDGIPRTARRASRTLAKASIQFLQRTGRKPSPEELAAEAGIPLEKLSYVERQALMTNKLSVDAMATSGQSDDGEEMEFSAMLPAAREDSPLAKMARSEMKDMLVEGLKELSDRERSILVLYYYEGIMFNEIAAAMEVSESRVSQLHARALDRLKRRITCQRIESKSDESNAEGDDA